MLFMQRVHNRDHFYKYVTKDVAKLIIQNQKLKWSCPLEFNDPYDHKICYMDISNLNDLTKRIIDRLVEYIWIRDDVTFDITKLIGATLSNFKKYKGKISKDIFLKNAEQITENLIAAGHKAHETFMDYVHESLSQTRVLCLTEENDNLLMWSHYSDSHTGSAFKLNVIEELDVSLLMAKKVTYSTTYPCISTEDELIDNMLCVVDIDYNQRYKNLVCVKSTDWAYEKEWRISINLQDHSINEETLLQEAKEVFSAIYLGCRMPLGDKAEIIELVQKHLPEMEVWQSVESINQYKLEFEKISI